MFNGFEDNIEKIMILLKASFTWVHSTVTSAKSANVTLAQTTDLIVCQSY